MEILVMEKVNDVDTLQHANVAMENPLFIDDFPSYKPPLILFGLVPLARLIA